MFVAPLPLWPQSTPAEAAEVTGKEALSLAVFAPRPAYPYEARAKREQGSGIAVLTVDPATGNVTNVVMAPSTGVEILDNATISAYRRWRFKPGTVKTAKLPVSFALVGAGVADVGVVQVRKALPMEKLLTPLLGKGNVINAPTPVYPPHPLHTSKQGRGVYEIHVNKAGDVTEVKILKSSGDETFDQVTVDTLRQWRLRHGPKIIELPLVFVLTPENYRVWIQ